MKILHVEAGMHLYGGALQVVFLMRGLKEAGVECMLACPEGSAIAEAASPHAQVIQMPMKGDLDIGLVRRLRQLIRDRRPDVVHLHSRRGSDVWGGLAGRLEGVPTIVSRRVDNPEPPWLARRKYGLYDRVITISEGIRQVLLNEGVPASHVECVHSAVDTTQYRPSRAEHIDWFRSTFAIPPDALTIGMIAQFIPRKGHQSLLDALPVIAARHPNVKVLMLGQGPLSDTIAQQVQASELWSRHILLPGFRKDLDRVLPCLDLVAHPAFMEGLGVSLLQAAACGIPIVAGRAGGIPEIVRSGLNGELVDPGDVAGLALAINNLLSDPVLRQQYGTAGRRLVEAQFSIPAMVAGNLAVYRRVRRTP